MATIMRLLRYARLQPFDQSTLDGRAAERYRRAFWTVFANVGSKAASLLVMVASVSLTVPYLGAERFGVWMTVASFSSMLIFLGLGIGNALTNAVAAHHALDDKSVLCRVISGGLGLLALVGVATGVVLYQSVRFLPWEVLIKANNPSLLSEAREVAYIFAILFAIHVFTTGLQSVFAGLQRSFEAHWISMAGSICSLILLWRASREQAGIVELLLATFGVQTLFSLVLLFLLLKRHLLAIAGIGPAIRSESARLIKAGSLFLVLQVGTMVGWGSDALIISSTLGPAAVAVYSVTYRLFQFVSQPLSIVNAPLWGAYADARARDDKEFIKATFRTSMLLTLVLSLVAVMALMAVGPIIVRLWTHSAFEVPLTFLYLAGVWTVFECCGVAFGMFLNGMNIIKPQVVVVLIFCLFVLPIKLLLVSQIGLVAVPLAAIAIYASTHLLFYGVIFLPQIKKQLARTPTS